MATLIVINIIAGCAIGYFMSKLFNNGDFDLGYCVAAIVGVFIGPSVANYLFVLLQIQAGSSVLIGFPFGSRSAFGLLGCLVYLVVSKLVVFDLGWPASDDDAPKSPKGGRLPQAQNRAAPAPSATGASVSNKNRPSFGRLQNR